MDELGLTKNTIIIFSSDNGPVLDDGYADDAVAKNGSHQPAGPYRGWKTSVYEGGTRVPFIVSWPGKIKPGVTGAMVSRMDLVASFANFFKQDIPHGEANDSENMLPALMGKSDKGRRVLVEEGYNNLAVINEDWKYIEPYRKSAAELFLLSNDPGEKNNLLGKHPEKIKELSELLNSIKLKK